jgi:hypothetical protein
VRPGGQTASRRGCGADTPTGKASRASRRAARRPRGRPAGGQGRWGVRVGTPGVGFLGPAAVWRRAKGEWAWIRFLHPRPRSPATCDRFLGAPPLPRARSHRRAGSTWDPGGDSRRIVLVYYLLRCHRRGRCATAHRVSQLPQKVGRDSFIRLYLTVLADSLPSTRNSRHTSRQLRPWTRSTSPWPCRIGPPWAGTASDTSCAQARHSSHGRLESAACRRSDTAHEGCATGACW